MPTLTALEVRDYKLYPGTPRAPGIKVQFTRGPWVVLGVNGLGKSTLLLIIRSMLTGPFWVASAGPAGSQRNDIASLDRNIFGSRVSDGAAEAIATLEVSFGSRALSVTRRLSNLSLVGFQYNGKHFEGKDVDEERYRSVLKELMGVGSFADALRILRYLTFVLEDRDGLIWDSRAQTEIFRAVFMSPERSARWRELEGTIVSSDSSARNINASLYKIIQRHEREQRKKLSEPQVRARLAALSGEQDHDAALELEALAGRDAAEDRRLDARDALRLREQEEEERRRDYERLKYHALSQVLSGITPSDQYVVMRIISEHICPACGSEVESYAAELETRKNSGRCLVCGSARSAHPAVVTTEEFSEARAAQAYDRLLQANVATEEARTSLDQAEQDYRKVSDTLDALRRAQDLRAREIRSLQRRLPADERKGGREFDEIEALRARVLQFRRDRDIAETELEGLLLEARNSVEAVKAQIEEQFRIRAGQFLLDGFRLVYAPDRRTIGQTGRQLEFPAFEVELAGGGIDGKSVRRTANQVSLSQREYLDLAFRMAVMEIVASTASTLVVDGPEGSVDAVFAERAGELLAAFSHGGRGNANRLLVACNLVDTPLIPALLAEYESKADREARVVNLLEVALPTTALSQLRAEYVDAFNRVLRGSEAHG